MFPIESLYFTIPIFVISILTARKVFFSFFDPLLLPVFALSSSIGLMFQYYFSGSFANITLLIVFLLCHLAFIFGLKYGRRTQLRLSSVRLFCSYSYVKFVFVIAILLLLIIFLLMFKTTGIAFLQENPEAAKNLNFTGGLGTIKRVLPPLADLAIGLFLVLNTYSKRTSRLLNFVAFAVIGITTLAMGAKGALYGFYVLFVFWLVFRQQNFGLNITRRHRSLLILLALIVLLGASFILTLTVSRTTGLTGKDLFDETRQRLADRIIGFGDISLFYFHFQTYKGLTKTPIDFISSIGNVFLGPLRIVDYIKPLGAELYSLALGVPNEANYGPNAQVYFVGVIYFGYLVGIFYAFSIGYVTAFLRKIVFLSFRQTNIDLLIFLIANVIIAGIPIDLTYIISYSLSSLVVTFFIFSSSFVLFTILTETNPLKVLVLHPKS